MREAYLFGPFRLLAHQRELFAHGVPIPVGQRAFDILLVLVSRHGHLVTKDELMAEVWPGVIVEENNIQVHISALRKVLGTDGDPKRYLVTVPGRGYRFVAPVKTGSADHSAPSTAALAEQTAAAPGTVGSQQAGNNLPNQLTSLIGRETEVAEIKAELSNYRLVTLTGAGGVGKTRLAIEVGRSLLERYPDGVWFVELAPLTDAQLISPTIGAILGVSLGASSAPNTALAAALRTKQLLLILDNCEHVIEQAARIAEALIRVCAQMTILATSRERLAIADRPAGHLHGHPGPRSRRHPAAIGVWRVVGRAERAGHAPGCVRCCQGIGVGRDQPGGSVRAGALRGRPVRRRRIDDRPRLGGDNRSARHDRSGLARLGCERAAGRRHAGRLQRTLRRTQHRAHAALLRAG